MIFLSWEFYVFLFIALSLYYIIPIKARWSVLLVANLVFYYYFYKEGWWIIISTALVSYVFSRLFDKVKEKNRKILFIISLVLVVIPWILAKESYFWFELFDVKNPIKILVPLGISFYTMEIIAYLSDVYRGKIASENNFFRYLLFVSFFPKLIQGPIHRYDSLAKQLSEGNKFREDLFVKGFYYVLWGFFLKLMIADKAGIIVNKVFDNYPAFKGTYIWVAMILYSVQLYTDFLACTTMAQGISFAFGIELVGNFNHPYFSKSVREFWRRWHMSLSYWLRDYIYIPLGGSRKGDSRKYLNLFITFIISGIWHGAGIKYIFWGILHGFFQVAEGCIFKVRRNQQDSKYVSKIKNCVTFLLVSFAWVIFRALSLATGLNMICSMFVDFNPWVLFNDRLFSLGLSWKQCFVLIVSLILLFKVERFQEDSGKVSDILMEKPLVVRWVVLITGIVFIVVLGTYGFGYNSQDFIYGGF